MAVGRECVCGLALILLCLVSPVWANIDVSAARPNILLIVAEDMSPRVGAYGDAVARTPSIDRLARDGLRFDRVFTVSGVCAPSRSSLITGVYATSMGTHQMRTSQGVPGTDIESYEAVPPPRVKAFPELLRAHGYSTANFAKKDYQFGDPFTIWDLHLGEFVGPVDAALWRRLPFDKPWFVMMNLMATHESRLFATGDVFPKEWEGLITALDQERKTKIAQVTDPSHVSVPAFLPDTPPVRHSIAQHYDNIHYMDAQVGRILEALEADGLADNTIVIWTTDHGDGFPRAKRSVYDSGTRVPLIVRFPDRSYAAENDARLVSFVDIAPTILGFAGVDVPDFIQGHDIFSNERNDYVFAARDRMDATFDRVRAVRDVRYRLIENFAPELAYFRPLLFRDMFPIMKALWEGQSSATLGPAQSQYFDAPRSRYELYDLEKDPQEVNNLAELPAYAEIKARLIQRLRAWRDDIGDLGNMPELEMVMDMWGGVVQPVTRPPIIRQLSETVAGDASEQGREFQQIMLEETTVGSSLGYRIDGGVWQLYNEPVAIVKGQSFEAKAVRYGFKESEIAGLP
jgi:N-sulfoglucosamine sulfohydrolase